MNEEKEKNTEPEINWEQKADEYLNGWKRAQADYQNREKEIGKEREVLRGFFEESIISEFLPVLDNLKKATEECAELSSAHNQWVRGIEQVAKQFEDILKKFGVERIDVLDKGFDPAVAEALDRSLASSSAKATDDGEATDGTENRDGNKVIKVVAEGYKKGERVIRPARVIVG